MPTTFTRIAGGVAEHMLSSQAAHDRNDWPEAHDLIAKIRAKGRNADGSYRLHLTDPERQIVYYYAEMLAEAASDRASDRDTDALADLSAARAVLRRLERDGLVAVH